VPVRRPAQGAAVMSRRGLLWLAASLLMVITAWLYATRLNEAPIYLAHDEIKFALQAEAIAATGRDINGVFMPLFFAEPGFTAGRDPVSIYLTALFLKVLPFGESAIRLPSAVVGVLDVVLMFFLAHRLFTRLSLAVVAAGLLALTPAHFIYSRFGLDVQYPLPFLMAWLWCLLAYLEGGNVRTLFIGTAMLGLGAYSYLAFLVMTPVYVLITGYTVWRHQAALRQWSLQPYVMAAIGFALPLVPLLWWHVAHPTRYSDMIGAYRLYDPQLNPLQGAKDLASYFSFGVRSDVYWNYFNPSFLFFSGDSSVVNSTRQVGVFLVPVAVLLPLGVYRILTVRRTPFTVALLWGFATAPIAAVLLAEVAIRRSLVMLPFAVLIATFGVEALVQAPSRAWRIAGVALLLAIPLQFHRFYSAYLGDYRVRSSGWLGGNIRGGLLEIIERSARTPVPAIYLSNGIPYVDAYWDFYLIKHRRRDLAGRTVYFDPKGVDVREAPGGTLVLRPIGEAPIQRAGAEPLKHLATISEPDGVPSFLLFER
jgi:4-amino-4-deoxy-L-arabinose transferase-like glycosyltransferase